MPASWSQGCQASVAIRIQRVNGLASIRASGRNAWATAWNDGVARMLMVSTSDPVS